MSDDPETARQIALLAQDDRPLLVLDVDDVLIEFLVPLPKFLKTQGFELRLENWRMTGNIYDLATGIVADQTRVSTLIDGFYAAQADWQTEVDGALSTLASLSHSVEIVMLTAMPHRHHAVRRGHLDRLGFCYPLITTEMPKGPAISRLRGASGRRGAFVDDQPRNLASALDHVSDLHAFHLMADNSARRLLPPLPAQATVLEDWNDAATTIASALGVRNS